MLYIVLNLIISSFLFSQESTFSAGDLIVKANYIAQIKNQVFATGNVEVRYKNLVLFADRIEGDTETKEVFAEGGVVIQLPNEVIECESIHFNMDSSEGELKKVLGMVQPSVFYEADNIQRKSENIFLFEKAKISSCSQPDPRWNFSFGKGTFKKDDYIEMWHPVFSIKKVPIFYFPYIRYPLKKDRATGILMPQMGVSGQKGFFYSQGFYWAMSRNMDATVNFDYYAARGMGGGVEYRYLFNGGTGGHVNFYYFDFKKDPLAEEPDQESSNNAFILRFKHNQPLPAGFSLVADIDYQSSYDFLREFDNNFRRAVVSNRSSQAYLSRSWSYFNLSVRASNMETYFVQVGSSIIRRNLPSVAFSSSKIKLFSPLYFSFSSNFSRWEYGWQSAYENNNQTRSQSLSFEPTLTLPFTEIPWLTLNTSFSASYNYYFQTYLPNTRKVVNEPLLSENYIFRTELLGPVFSKIYYDSQNRAKLKHIVEPALNYIYETPISSYNRIISASGLFYRTHQLNYSLTNRFIIKQNERNEEIIAFGVNQTYFLVPDDESPMQQYKVDGEVPKFSDIYGYLRLYPSSKYTFDFSVGLNPYFWTFSSLRASVSLGSQADPLFFRINWYKSLNPYLENVLYDRHQVGFYSGLKIPSLSLEALAEIDFNIAEMELLYSGFALIFNYQCIDIRADMRVFYFCDIYYSNQKPEMQFRITIGLGNIGKTTDFLGGMGF
ncbi:MAG: LPS-assembly protein LptD [Candidatus Aminicenantes bacterium]|nr:LPS-assembly protein LptD [Candidatus Aminicenantes bacterium]